MCYIFVTPLFTKSRGMYRGFFVVRAYNSQGPPYTRRDGGGLRGDSSPVPAHAAPPGQTERAECSVLTVFVNCSLTAA